MKPSEDTVKFLEIINNNFDKLVDKPAIVDKDDLLQAVSAYYHADKIANDNARLLVQSSMTSEEAGTIMKELEEAKQNLFRVAGLIE